MPRYSDKSPVRPDGLRSYADTLRELAKANDALSEWMEKQKIAEMSVTHGKTAKDGLESLAKFLGAAMSAYCQQVGAAGLNQLFADEAIRKATADKQVDTPRVENTKKALARKMEERAQKGAKS